MPNIRTFIAVDLPAEVKSQIGDTLAPLKPLSRSIRWVRDRGLHLTLKFLGQVPEERLPEIFASVEKALAGHSPFHFRLSGMGGFPNLRRPRVLWIGVPDGHKELLGLAKSVEQALIPCGFPPERRPFFPHLTVGRIKSPQSTRAVLERLPEIDYASVPIAADAVKVMKSDLKPTGAEYSALKIIELRAPAEGDSGRPVGMERDESIDTEKG
jgi:2'-5' RNA ligase